MKGFLVFAFGPVLGLLLAFYGVKSGELKMTPMLFFIICGAILGLLVLTWVALFQPNFSNDKRDLFTRIEEDIPVNFVVEEIPGFGLSVTANGKSVVVMPYDLNKDYAYVWDTDKNGAVTGHPLVVHNRLAVDAVSKRLKVK